MPRRPGAVLRHARAAQLRGTYNDGSDDEADRSVLACSGASPCRAAQCKFRAVKPSFIPVSSRGCSVSRSSMTAVASSDAEPSASLLSGSSLPSARSRRAHRFLPCEDRVQLERSLTTSHEYDIAHDAGFLPYFSKLRPQRNIVQYAGRNTNSTPGLHNSLSPGRWGTLSLASQFRPINAIRCGQYRGQLPELRSVVLTTTARSASAFLSPSVSLM